MLKFGDTYLMYGDTCFKDWISEKKYNPLNLPPYTIRLLYKNGITPRFNKGTGVQVSINPNIWDLTYNDSDWSWLINGFIYKDDYLLEILGANTKGVTDMACMLYECGSLSALPLFDTSNVTNMDRMFYYCNKLSSVPLFDTSNVTNMIFMFDACTRLSSVPLFDTNNVTNTVHMFHACRALTTVPLFNTNNVTNMSGMFQDCSNLTSVPLFNTSTVTSMGEMFRNCSALTSVPLFNTSNVTDMNSAFCNCYNVQSGALALYQQASTQAIPPTSHKDTFDNCGSHTQTGSAELAQIPNGWK